MAFISETNQVSKTNYDILSAFLSSTNEKITYSIAHLYFSSILLGHDYFDNITYSKDENPDDYNKVYCNRIKGYTMRFYYPYGTLQIHEKNLILFEYAGYKFIINESIIPFIMMPNTFGTTDEEQIEKAKVKVKRSDGTIQNALLDINDGLVIQEETNKILVKVLFYLNEKEGDEPIHYTVHEYEPNNKSIRINFTKSQNEIMHKYVDLDSFLEVNPDFKFHVSVSNPLTEHKKIYDEYICDNTDMKDMYDCLNLYYKFELQKYFQMVHDMFSEDTKSAFQYDIYSHNPMRFLTEVKPMLLEKE